MIWFLAVSALLILYVGTWIAWQDESPTLAILVGAIAGLMLAFAKLAA